MIRYFVPFLLGIGLSGCASNAALIERQASLAGMAKVDIEGTQFTHTIFALGDPDSRQRINIYIDGDGQPWRYGRYIAKDPTPTKSVALALMSRDPGPAVYLGRPCFVRLTSDKVCESSLWTSGRYSEAVVASMVAALQQYQGNMKHRELRLIGFSGGGALAVLMAQHLPKNTSVVTIAANLDTDSWAQRHGYLPLTDSQNPMFSAELENLPHLHLVGTDDRNILPADIKRFSDRHRGNFVAVPGFTHLCCWEANWPDLLASLDHWLSESHHSITQAEGV